VLDGIGMELKGLCRREMLDVFDLSEEVLCNLRMCILPMISLLWYWKH
jgi:hypothetical protein